MSVYGRIAKTGQEIEAAVCSRRHRMRRIVFLPVVVVALAGAVAYMAPASGQADGEAAPIFGVKIPPGYRDWRLISVAHEEGKINDLGAILGNDLASDQGLAGRETSVPGRDHHCP